MSLKQMTHDGHCPVSLPGGQQERYQRTTVSLHTPAIPSSEGLVAHMATTGDVTAGENCVVIPASIPVGTPADDDYTRQDMPHLDWKRQQTTSCTSTFWRLGLLSISEKLGFRQEAQRYELIAHEASENRPRVVAEQFGSGTCQNSRQR